MTDLEKRIERLERIVLICKCQYGPGMTPLWYQSVKTCPVHGEHYRPQDAPAWAWADPQTYGLGR